MRYFKCCAHGTCVLYYCVLVLGVTLLFHIFYFTLAVATAPPGSGTTTIEALLRSRATIQDPSFAQLKYQFTVDFDGAAPGALKLHNLILRLRKWIKILEVKTRAYAK